MFHKIIKIFLFLLLISTINHAQKQINIRSLQSKFAKKENRQTFRSTLINFIDSSLSKPLVKENIKLFDKAFDLASLYFIKNDKVEIALRKVFLNYSNASHKLIYKAIQTAYNLYPDKFSAEIEDIFHHTEKSSVFSAAGIYLLNGKGNEYITRELQNKFENINSDPILLMLNYYLNPLNESIPPLEDLLSSTFQKNKTIVYSFQRKEREFPGITIVKSPEGKFVRNEDGTIFSIPHLALSASRFPGFLKSGNTPQGIYSIQKYYYSPTAEIGPSPILLSRIPFEIGADKFYHGEINSSKWDIDDYKNLLPDSWKDYLPIYESFFAGKSGRRVIVAHGSVDDPEFYKDRSYAPLTPTKGCLAAKEIWDEKGRLIESDQVKLMNAFFSTEQLYGFLIVVDIDDKKEPVTINELLPVIEKSELSSNLE